MGYWIGSGGTIPLKTAPKYVFSSAEPLLFDKPRNYMGSVMLMRWFRLKGYLTRLNDTLK